MEDKKGFVKLYRSMLTWEWYDDINVKILFLHLILTANYEDKKWRGKVIKRGQRVVSVKKLSEELGITVQQTRTAINKLISTNEITNSKFAECNVFTLINYDKFQAVTNETTNHQQTSNKRPTNVQQIDNKSITTTKEYKEIEEYKEYKEIKKGKENFPPFEKIEDDKLKQVLSDFKEMRKVMKKPMTEKAEQLLLNKLDNLSTDTEQQIKIVEQAIVNGWLSVYPLKHGDGKYLKSEEQQSSNINDLDSLAINLNGNYDSKGSNSKDQQSYDIDDLDSLAINLKK